MQRRARRGGRRRTITLLIAAAFAVLVVGSALAFGPASSTSSAPNRHRPRSSKDSRRVRRVMLYRFGLDTRVVGEQARTILDVTWPDGGSVYVAAAPMRGGGFCTAISRRVHVPSQSASGRLLEGEVSQCFSLEARATSERDHANEISADAWQRAPRKGFENGYEEFAGSVTARGTDHLVLRYEDGSEDEIPVTWVSKLIDAGFFAFDPPAAKHGRGHRALVFVAVNANGKELTRREARPISTGNRSGPLRTSSLSPWSTSSRTCRA